MFLSFSRLFTVIALYIPLIKGGLLLNFFFLHFHLYFIATKYFVEYITELKLYTVVVYNLMLFMKEYNLSPKYFKGDNVYCVT